ncbi:hypothetical protein [Pandoraea sp. B-6]|uniref:hypothetical protein n=1 Tax=Pandoraea sp. B-6 TaxID=1204340 RepID=UPI00034D720C|nr:hypothetical protein [Pandoraea sp. B-6]
MNTALLRRLADLIRTGAVTGIFSIYYLYYLTDFKDGEVTQLPPYIALAKYAVFAVFLVSLLPFRISTRYRDDILYVPLFAMCGLSYIGAIAMGLENPTALFLNTLIFLPVLFSARMTETGLNDTFRLVKNIILVQCVLGFALRAVGIDLWTGGAVSGGVGNPSSFGLLCCVSYLYVDTFSTKARFELPQKAILALGAVATNSVFSLLTIGAIVLLVEARNRRLFFILLAFIPAIVVASWLIMRAEASGAPSFLVHKILAVLNFVGLVDYEVTAGITGGRIADHINLVLGYIDNPRTMLWGHIDSTAYLPADSQYVSYLASFGIPLSVLFVFVNLRIYLRAGSARVLQTPQLQFLRNALVIFMINFFVNRILDYFPMMFIFLMIVIGLARSPSLAEVNSAEAT